MAHNSSFEKKNSSNSDGTGTPLKIWHKFTINLSQTFSSHIAIFSSKAHKYSPIAIIIHKTRKFLALVVSITHGLLRAAAGRPRSPGHWAVRGPSAWAWR